MLYHSTQRRLYVIFCCSILFQEERQNSMIGDLYGTDEKNQTEDCIVLSAVDIIVVYTNQNYFSSVFSDEGTGHILL